MLIQFSFNNYKSFKDETVLNLQALGAAKNSYYSHSYGKSSNVVKTAAVYGANASGKTKLFEAFRFLKIFVCPPKTDNRIPVLDYWKSSYDAFRLNTNMVDKASFFEAIFIIDDIQYRYGVELTAEKIMAEWLYMKKQREINVFDREDGEAVKINKEQINAKIANSIIAAKMVSPVSSFLAVLQTFNEPLANKVVDWFRRAVVISANDIRMPNESFSIPMMTDKDRRSEILNFLKAFDINVEDAQLHKIKVEDVPDKIKAIIGSDNMKGTIYDGVNMAHKLYNDLYERVGDVWLSMERDESYGTNRLFWLSWAIILSIKKGSVLFIDEFDSGIHPSVAKLIIELFNESNTTAQLIINTQNVSLLNCSTEERKKLFTKQQIFLVNKNRYGESSLVPLTDFNGIARSRLDELYLNGDIGGTPYLNRDMVMGLINTEEP